MPNYFRNLEQTIESQSEGELSPQKKLRRWINQHLRLVWNIVTMIILIAICLWASFFVGNQHEQGSIIENIAPEVKEAQDVEGQLEKAARSLNN